MIRDATPQFHPRSLTRGMNFALWLQIPAIIGSCAASAYLIYTGWTIYRQLASVGAPLPPNGLYLILGGVLLLAFSLWRLLRAISHLRRFRLEYRAHVDATRRA
jgi:heme/copper-type cytochrome/quinol oxidase subunit 1